MPLPEEVRRARRRYSGGVWSVIVLNLCLVIPPYPAFALARVLREFSSGQVAGIVFLVGAFGPYVGMFCWLVARGTYLEAWWPCPACPGRLLVDTKQASRAGTQVLVCRRCRVRW